MIKEDKLENLGSNDFTLERSLLCCCAETIFFIHNNNDITLEKLLQSSECSAFSLAKMIIPYLHFTNEI